MQSIRSSWLGGKLEINSPHYPTAAFDYYPENAYTLTKFADHVSRWPWKRDKPWWVPESTFADDLNLATYAIGDEAYRGQDDAQRGKAVFQRMLFGGYRWTGATGWSCSLIVVHLYRRRFRARSPSCCISRMTRLRLTCSPLPTKSAWTRGLP